MSWQHAGLLLFVLYLFVIQESIVPMDERDEAVHHLVGKYEHR